MKELTVLLAGLRQQGVRLWVEGDRLKLRASAGAVAPELTAELKQRKAEIMAFLQPAPVYSIPAVAARVDYELSPAQRRLWVLSQLSEGSAAYNIPLHQFLEGTLEPAALEKAFSLLVQRHDSLRTTFTIVGVEPRQVVHPHLDVPLESRDLSGQENGEEIARRWGREEAERPFDLATGPLLRACLIKLAHEKYALLFTIHHMIADGISLSVLARDLSRLYEGICTNRPANLPVLAIGYPAYTVWQNRLLNGELMAVHREYWQHQLAGELPVLNLPTDYPRPPVQTFRGRELSFTLAPERVEALRKFCYERGASLFMALHAAVKVLLFAYTGQDDIIVACAVAGREHADLEDQVGFFLNTVPLRSHVRGETPFEEFFGQVVRTTAEALDHQIYPFDYLVTELNVKRDLSRFPLFDVVLILQNQDEPGLALGGVRARPVFEHPGTSKFDLTFCFKETYAGLVLGIEYNTGLFREDRIRRMGGHFLEVIRSILANPGANVGRLNVLPEHERRHLLYEFNQTAAPCPRDQTVVDLLESAEAKTPDAVAMAFGLDRLTYRQLHARANQLAHYLRARGVRPETPVGICVGRSLETVIGLLGILKAGGAYVPLDPTFPKDRLAYILEDAGVSLIVTREGSRGKVQSRQADLVDLDDDREDIARCPVVAPCRQLEPHHLAYLIYTSGSTGRPKGVAIPHRSLVNFLTSMARSPGLAQDDVLVAVSTISFDIAGLEIFLPLVQGARVVIAEEAEAADGVRLAELLRQSAATVMQATPATWRLLLAAGWAGNPCLKVLCGGEALPGRLAGQLLERSGSVWNMYGPTETTIWSTIRQLEGPSGARRDAIESIGRPIANTEIYILDRDLRPVPLGVPGELYIGGDGLALGYHNLPELTEEKFLPHPFFDDPKRRVYKTGDTARYRDDGDIEYLGRTDQQVKLRGFRIELGEIESVLAAHPDVAVAAVDARSDRDGDKCLVAWYVSSNGQDLSVSGLREHLKDQLPDYMLPVRFVRLANLPMTPNGKVDRNALAEPTGDAGATATYEPPRTDWERNVARLWEDVLKVARVGVHDNFFELGGHSLKAALLITRLKKETGARLELIDVFYHPTVAELASLADQRGTAPPCEILSGSMRTIKTMSTEMAPPHGIPQTDRQRDVIEPATAGELEMLNE